MLIERETPLSDGKMLDFSTKVKDILPEWRLKDEYASDRIDLMDLLIHRTGLPSHACFKTYDPEPRLVPDLRSKCRKGRLMGSTGLQKLGDAIRSDREDATPILPDGTPTTVRIW